MHFDILSLFPEFFEGPFDVSIIKNAKKNKIVDISLINIRDFAKNKHKKVDDRPFGGGPGMVLSPQPVIDAIRATKKPDAKVIYLSPQGRKLNNQVCEELAKEKRLVLLCGHYEGIDERVLSEVDEEISIGDYILSSGCPAAVVLVDSVIRFLPGALGNEEGVQSDSFQNGFFEGPQYTRPRVFEDMGVPEILLQGDHKKIQKWRDKQGYLKTQLMRPDLFVKQN